jgi:hypothetical protein
MDDESYLDRKYFIDTEVYNCPFCNRNNVKYSLLGKVTFDWTTEKKCYIYFVQCSSCNNQSMHLSYEDMATHHTLGGGYLDYWKFNENIDLDSVIFYSVPTSFFVIDSRIPKIIRELITEAEGCLKMNFMTGASACMRKAIYELLVLEKVAGEHYEDRIKVLKEKYPASDPDLFDILGHIQQMTSDKVHEQSWEEWDSKNLRLIIETLRTVLYDIYVTPQIKAERSNLIKQLRENVSKKNSG